MGVTCPTLPLCGLRQPGHDRAHEGGRRFRPVRLKGLIAWVLWSVAHVYFLIGFRNRFFVATGWAWSYLTYQARRAPDHRLRFGRESSIHERRGLTIPLQSKPYEGACRGALFSHSPRLSNGQSNGISGWPLPSAVWQHRRNARSSPQETQSMTAMSKLDATIENATHARRQGRHCHRIDSAASGLGSRARSRRPVPTSC